MQICSQSPFTFRLFVLDQNSQRLCKHNRFFCVPRYLKGMLSVTFLHLCTYLVVWSQLQLYLLEQHPLASTIVYKTQASRLRKAT